MDRRGAWLRAAGTAAVAFLCGITCGAEPVGNETCAVCHDDVASVFATTVHGRVDPEGSCESCHGPGSDHVEEGDPARIFRFGPMVDSGARASACLGCHQRSRETRAWSLAEHAVNDVACDNCHDPHGAGTTRALLREATPDLCMDCHAAVRAEFARPERHPVESGGIDCVDCHDPHGPSRRATLGGFESATCLRCHAEYRGPWFFEHEAVAVEGCVACHAPHGSVNRHLLTYQRVGDLCLQCHPSQPYFHVVTDPSGARTTSFNDCTRCHTEIHGSNNDALFLN